ncbi:hypothetical protein JTE90_019373 [Oedothorax gibbosus]|uniref:Uncharacterized protein n=1 Tax=Oedothorax gibbosus TaxID=931172 RepID=A0AAV6TT11_9ARAC|nr:hypothetical protein JTE90_019373 [Oedothorax gibbosus]
MDLLIVLTLLKTVWIASCEVDPFEDFEEAMAECNDALHCVINNPKLVRDVNMSGGPEFTRMSVIWMREFAHYEVPFDGSVEYYGNYSKHICAMPKERKREIYKKYFDVGYEFYMDNCGNMESEECVKFMNFIVMGKSRSNYGNYRPRHCLKVVKLLPMPEEMKELAEVTSKAVNAAKDALGSMTKLFG